MCRLWARHRASPRARTAFWGEPPLESVQPGAPTDSDLGLVTQDFDQLLEILHAALAKDTGTGVVFSCLSGQGRTTTAMVVAVLASWHIRVCEAACVRTGVCPGRLGTQSLGTLCQQGVRGGRGDARCGL